MTASPAYLAIRQIKISDQTYLPRYPTLFNYDRIKSHVQPEPGFKIKKCLGEVQIDLELEPDSVFRFRQPPRYHDNRVQVLTADGKPAPEGIDSICESRPRSNL